ncbi:MAG: hypothetical protein EPO32_03215 [Anaerolineae bacterium]|nr:MAG: hypothetical protein EPO32_03215 [Anaerolineae bacterium]
MSERAAKTPSMVQVFINDLPRMVAWMRKQTNRFVNNFLFSTSATSGARRQWLFTIVLGALWGRSAFGAHPIQLTGNLLSDLIVYPFPALFGADTLRHVVVFVMVFLLGLRIAASFLDDVFELNDVALAERYILQSVFASQYSRITIRDGAVADEHVNSPVTRIGGPGLVKVHLNNVALFEKMDGSPDVIGPLESARAHKLDRFERLRAVVELPDQNLPLNKVSARTKDGIFVTAEGGKILYSVARNPKREASLKNPMTYDRESIERIVYGEVVFKHFKSRHDKTLPPPKEAGGKVDINMQGFIQSELGRFISQSFLSEFLTPPAGSDDYEREDLDDDDLDAEDSTLESSMAETMPSVADEDEDEEEQTDFISRDSITREFLNIGKTRARERGMELHWIDIGTWSLPEEAREVQDQHLEFWRMTAENRTRRMPEMLELTLEESRKAERLRLFREVPLGAYYEYAGLRETNPAEVVRRMLMTYRERVRNAWNAFVDRGETPPDEIDMVAKFLNSRLARHVRQNGNNHEQPSANPEDAEMGRP